MATMLTDVGPRRPGGVVLLAAKECVHNQVGRELHTRRSRSPLGEWRRELGPSNQLVSRYVVLARDGVKGVGHKLQDPLKPSWLEETLDVPLYNGFLISSDGDGSVLE
jgi:hypothetical protein